MTAARLLPNTGKQSQSESSMCSVSAKSRLCNLQPNTEGKTKVSLGFECGMDVDGYRLAIFQEQIYLDFHLKPSKDVYRE